MSHIGGGGTGANAELFEVREGFRGVRYFGTQSLIPFGFNIAEPHLVARPLKEKKKEEKRGKLQNIVLLCNM